MAWYGKPIGQVPSTAFFPAPHGMLIVSCRWFPCHHHTTTAPPSSQCWTSSSLFNDQNGDGVIGRGCSGMAWCTVELEPTEKWPVTFFWADFFQRAKTKSWFKTGPHTTSLPAVGWLNSPIFWVSWGWKLPSSKLKVGPKTSYKCLMVSYHVEAP